MTAKAAVGDLAPDFELEGLREGETRTYSLGEFKGAPLVLVFYPKDDTPVCTRQLNDYSENISEFADLGAQVLAISPQGLDAHGEFADGQGGFSFPLLADESKSMFAAYGALGPLGFPRRSVFVLDDGGVIIYSHRSLSGMTFRPVGELTEALKTLTAE